ncbi:MAG: tetratricopeptide repeat protein [Deltaproteobacteria bacterium]|nr:MAG: tetratricopeptide repeat protein [Deltaproteobacteria bacterium]
MLVERDENERAAELLGQILERQLSPARRDDFASELADLLWKQGRTEEARKLWAELALRHPSEPSRRLAKAKLDASRHLPAGDPVLGYLIDPSASAGWLLRLRESAEQQPGWGLPWYLLGRALYNRGEYELAQRYLQKSLELGLLDVEARAEAMRLQVICLFHLGHWRRAAVRLAAMSMYPGRLADPAWAADWFELLEFAQRQPSCAPRTPPGRKFPDSGR